MGISPQVKTQLFTGIVKELPIYKPDEYKLELRLVSPLEFLRDIETKDFSDKITGETLTLDHQEEEENPFYKTAQTGVGGIEAVYADGVKLFAGVDYDVSDLNNLSQQAMIEIINKDLFGKTFTSDYYVWKRNLSVSEIITGLLTMCGFAPENLKIETVAWNTLIRNQFLITQPLMTFCYGQQNNDYTYTGGENWLGPYRESIFPENFKINFKIWNYQFMNGYYALGDLEQTDQAGQAPIVKNGILIDFTKWNPFPGEISISWIKNGETVVSEKFSRYPMVNDDVEIIKTSSTLSVNIGGILNIKDFVFNPNTGKDNEAAVNSFAFGSYYKITEINSAGDELNSLSAPGIITQPISVNPDSTTWTTVRATLSDSFRDYKLSYRTSKDGELWGNWQDIFFDAGFSEMTKFIQFRFIIASVQSIDNPPTNTDVKNFLAEYLAQGLVLNMVNLSGQSVLEAIEDFALITGYEFGLDRLGNFFFRPRLTSNIPTAVLDGTQLVKIGNIQKKLNNFFTKLVLLFGATPLEFYANDGEKPTLIDRYGVLTKEIDRPQIVNYDNPELAQAIGPQLLSVYSSLKNQISATAKLNLSLDLGDIINLKRELPLTVNPQASDLTKYESLNTYYRACKIIGLSYDFDKRQVKYTLQDVSDNNTKPQYEFNEFKYLLPVEFGVKE
ncbi:MAG: hypothetical protein PUB86_07290 [Elusimicrobia bacterium]|nr:hypothetical protein [Elusimicrobiota bacterium]